MRSFTRIESLCEGWWEDRAEMEWRLKAKPPYSRSSVNEQLKFPYHVMTDLASAAHKMRRSYQHELMKRAKVRKKPFHKEIWK
jgi:hypothetical protein